MSGWTLVKKLGVVPRGEWWRTVATLSQVPWLELLDVDSVLVDDDPFLLPFRFRTCGSGQMLCGTSGRSEVSSCGWLRILTFVRGVSHFSS